RRDREAFPKALRSTRTPLKPVYTLRLTSILARHRLPWCDVAVLRYLFCPPAFTLRPGGVDNGPRDCKRRSRSTNLQTYRKFYMYTASPAPKRGMTMPLTAR